MTFLLTLYRGPQVISVPITAKTFEEASQIGDQLARFSGAESIALHPVNQHQIKGRAA